MQWIRCVKTEVNLKACDMISRMSSMQETNDSAANQLCKACGLCCTGHLFIWTKLRSAELDSIEALGVPVIRSIPSQRGFNQPCPLWDGQCTIYSAGSYPRFCRTYQCASLKKLLDETISLPEALRLVGQARQLIIDLEALLPDSHSPNFRERLASHLEAPKDKRDNARIRQKAERLLRLYAEVFGVDDLIETRAPG